jgi:hypothetical protein
VTPPRHERTLTSRDLIVLSVGFSAAMTIGALMLVGSQVRGGAPQGWEVAIEPVSVDGSSSESLDIPSPTPTQASSTKLGLANAPDVAADAGSSTPPDGEAPVVTQRPPGDGTSDGAAPSPIVETSPSPTIEAAITPDPMGPPDLPPPGDLVADAPTGATAPAVDVVPAGDPPAVPPGLARQALDASGAATGDDGWGSAVSDARHADGRGRDDSHAHAHRPDR